MENIQRMMKVTNRSSSRIGYDIPDLHIYRALAPGESIQVPYDELARLSWQPGGRALMEQYMMITGADAEQALDELQVMREPESYMSKDDVIELLQNGSEDELLDALDFAPAGVIDLIKDEAMKMKLNDLRKRDIIKEKTGFDITKAIDLSDTSDEGVAPAAAVTSKRRTTGSKYKVVSKG